jgi:hypothetical protein
MLLASKRKFETKIGNEYIGSLGIPRIGDHVLQTSDFMFDYVVPNKMFFHFR